MRKSDCVKAVQAMGANKKEAEELVEEILNERKRLGDSGELSAQKLSEAWQATSEAMKREAAALERRTAQALLKFNEMKGRIDAIKAQGISGLDAIQANLVGISRRFNGARDSISAQREAILRSWTATLMRDLEAIDNGVALDLVQTDKAFHDDVMREMRTPGSTQSESARKVAEVFANTLENTRQRLNAAGADIGKLDGWTPQTHDPEKMLAGGNEAGRQNWIDFMMEHLDHERTFDGVGLVDAAKAREILSGVYDTLTLGKNPHIEADFKGGGSSGVGPASLAKKLGKTRTLHFKDANSAVLYNDTYGRGSIFDAMVHRLEQDARALSLMDRLGPNPEYTLQRLLDREKEAIAKDASLTQVEKDKQITKINNAMATGSIRAGKIANWMAELTGEANWSVNRLGARIGSFLRATQSLAKLGGATLSAVADVFIKASAIRTNGDTWPGALTKSVGQYFENIKGDKREYARQCGAFLDNVVGDIAARWDINEGLGKRMSKLQDFMFKYSGLNWLTERGKSGYTLWLSGHIGEVAGKTFDQLDAPRRAMLEYHGVTPERWELMRKMVREAEDGKMYFTPDAVDRLTDADLANVLPDNFKSYSKNSKVGKSQWERLRGEEIERQRNKLRFDSMAMLVDETKFAIIEPDDATRALMRQGTRPGTIPGEMWRVMTQFKSFPIAYMQRIMGGRRWVRGDRQQGMRYGFNAGAIKDSFVQDMPGFVGFVLSSIAFGYAAMTAKDIAKGKTPRDLTKQETWMAAVMQSGGLGIFGDFFFGKVDRFGNSFASDLVGPVLGSVGELTSIGTQLLHGEVKTAGEDALKFGINNAPMINLWYTRQALDWLLLYHVREMLSPGTLRRSERNMQKDYGQSFMYSPAEHIKRGGWGYK